MFFFKRRKNNLKMFVAYHKDAVITQDLFKDFRSEVFTLLNTSINTGDNIAHKNPNYAEMSGWYWVWKNYLPTAQEDYIGFCHYRRFPDFNIRSNNGECTQIKFKKFKKIFNRWKNQDLTKKFNGHDIIVALKINFGEQNVYEQFEECCGEGHLDLALEVIKDKYPEYEEAFHKVMNSHEMFYCLNFIMKKPVLNEFFEWIFDFCAELDKRTNNWEGYSGYNIRMPAFLAERLISVWLDYNARDVLLLPGYLIINETSKDNLKFPRQTELESDTGSAAVAQSNLYVA